VSKNCGNCAAFDREHLIHHAGYANGVRHPAVARCRNAPPPWQAVNDTDWCRAWSPRPGSSATLHEDNGA
jgi:hypothetical protein